jgi:ATP-binding cassette, subfamily B, bacterial
MKDDLSTAITDLIGLIGRSDWLRIGFAVTLILTIGVLTSLPAWLIGQTVDGITSGQVAWSTSLKSSLIYLAATVTSIELLQFARKWLIESVAVKLQAILQNGFASTLLSVPVDALHMRHIGEIITQIDKGVTGMVRLMKLAFLEFGPALAAATVAVGVVFLQNIYVGLMLLLVVLSNAGLTIWQIRSQRGIRMKLLDQRMEFNGRVGELIGNLESVRASGIAKAELHDFSTVSDSLRVTEFQHHRMMMSFDAAKGFSDGGGLIGVLLLSLWLLSKGQVTGGEVLMIGLLYQKATDPLKLLHRVVDESHEAAIHVLKAAELKAVGLDPGLSGVDAFSDVTDGIIFEASGLSCSMKDGREILRSLNYRVTQGAFDIITGETGSGKSTLMRILLGLQYGYQGSAKLLGTEIRSSNKEMLSERICYVAQSPFLKAGTLRTNLIVGLRRDVLDSELERAMSLAGMDLKESAWSEGLNRKIAERGNGLSGGEKQRIAIARLFLSHAEVFILDESTSQLDEPMEALVLGNLQRMALGKKSIIMIAHRGSTLKWASRVLKLEEGRITVVPASVKVA